MRDDFDEVRENSPKPDQAAELPAELPELKLKRGIPFRTKALQTLGVIGPAFRRFFKKDSMPNLVLVMALITSITAAGLGAVYAVTKDTIELNKGSALNDALSEVLPVPGLTFTETSPGIYQGRDADGGLAGFALEIAADGFAGKGSIEMIVGVDIRLQITGLAVLSQRETTGFANDNEREWFISQFIGKTGPFAVGEGVDAIAGATVSSEAVAQGVNDALGMLEQEASE
ncbi:MAG: FMN-binding protein [Oscillospiraceae bacterium]|nr:FMN-binding protein [Oscillospiraceae bacterium]